VRTGFGFAGKSAGRQTNVGSIETYSLPAEGAPAFGFAGQSAVGHQRRCHREIHGSCPAF
jgi:hypothetical protein